jgi:uncharacterized membrane protein
MSKSKKSQIPKNRDDSDSVEKEDEDARTADVILETTEGEIPGKLKILGELSGKIKILKSSTLWAGPLPSPEIMKEYLDISAELVPKIIEMAEREQLHRHNMDKRVLDAEIRDGKNNRNIEKRGQICALAIGTIAITSGALVAIFGNQLVGIFVGGPISLSGVGALVYAFLKRPVESTKSARTGEEKVIEQEKMD